MTTKKVSTTSKSVRSKRTVSDLLTEPSTWCGLLTIGATLATGGLAAWLNPATLPALTAGVGLILAREAKGDK